MQRVFKLKIINQVVMLNARLRIPKAVFIEGYEKNNGTEPRQSPAGRVERESMAADGRSSHARLVSWPQSRLSFFQRLHHRNACKKLLANLKFKYL